MAYNIQNEIETLDTLYMTKTSLADPVIPQTLWACGYNNHGQLGLGDITNQSVLTQVTGTDWAYVACGYYFTIAIKTDGTLWSSGYDAYGQLGLGSIVDQSFLTQTIAGGTNWKQASCSKWWCHMAAVKTDGTLWTCGYNNYGQLGDNTTINKSSPVQEISGSTNWASVSCGSFNVNALKTDGTIWTWGDIERSTTPLYYSSPTQYILGTDWAYVATGRNSNAAIKTDGTLWMWGYNAQGQLGTGTAEFAIDSPVQTIAGGTNWESIAFGNDHAAAIKTDGTLWLWGANTYGQLGDNTRLAKSSPVQTSIGGTDWKYVACSDRYTVAIKTDSTLWSWGRNTRGQLMDGTILPHSVPVQVISGGTGWIQISCGLNSTEAIKI